MKRFLLLMVLCALLAAGFLATSFYRYYSPRSYLEQPLMIERGTPTPAILDQLHADGYAPHPAFMLAPLMLEKLRQAPSLKAGEYQFAPNLSPAEIIGIIRRGEVVVHKVTILEGWNVFQARDALMKEPLLTGDMPVMAEGSLFPDTMHFSRGESRAAVVARMQKTQREMLAELWPTRAENLPLKTPEEAMIMASIIEKETGVDGERAKVAGVFINRLRIGMPLQTDPSVVYGVELAQAGKPMGRQLLSGDLQRDTPHNTYTRQGLPPTPICNPGRAALVAALNPETTDALYFVATGTGGHAFATNLKDHNANVAAYRAVLRASARGAPAMDTKIKQP
jgi:UPF0755 protein